MKSRRGFALMMTVALTGITIPMVGLAIDASLLYLTKARLSAAVDAAALAAARSLNRGMDLTSQRASASAAAQAYFNANFPSGYLLTTNPTFAATIDETQTKVRRVQIQASVDAPAYFMRVLGFVSNTVSATGTASRRDVNLILTLDRSYSLTLTNSCDAIKAAASTFVNNFAEGRDRVALLTFGGSYRVDFPAAFNFQSASPSVVNQINSIACNGYTGTAQALWQAYQQLVTINEPGALNVIVLFTDGQPNSLTANFPVKTQITSYAPTGQSTCLDAAGLDYTNPAWNPGPKLGVANGYPPSAGGYGMTGITSQDAGPIPVTPWDPYSPILDSNGCYFQPNPAFSGEVLKDIAYIPDQDVYGNSTWGYMANYSYPDGPYVGKIRTDVHSGIYNDSVAIAAINATDNAGQRIRNDANLKPVVYVIGLGGATDQAPHDLLRRISNDPSSPIYDTTKAAGLYIYAPSTAQLGRVFARIASEVLRLSQ